MRCFILLAGCEVCPLLCNQIITMIKLVARQFLSSNSTFIVPCSYSSYSVPDLTEVETLTQEILNHGHEHFDKWNIFSVYHIQSIIQYMMNINQEIQEYTPLLIPCCFSSLSFSYGRLILALFRKCLSTKIKSQEKFDVITRTLSHLTFPILSADL